MEEQYKGVVVLIFCFSVVFFTVCVFSQSRCSLLLRSRNRNTYPNRNTHDINSNIDLSIVSINTKTNKYLSKDQIKLHFPIIKFSNYSPLNIFNKPNNPNPYLELNLEEEDYDFSLPYFQEYNNEKNGLEDDKKEEKSKKEFNTIEEKKVELKECLEDNNTKDTCAICIEKYDLQDDIIVLTCNHFFHSDCIIPWLSERRPICPLCKHDYSYLIKQNLTQISICQIGNTDSISLDDITNVLNEDENENEHINTTTTQKNSLFKLLFNYLKNISKSSSNQNILPLHNVSPHVAF